MMDLDRQIDSVRDAIRRINRAAGVLKQDPFGVGLSLSQCHALMDIESQGALKMSDLVPLLNLDKSTVSRQVSGLIKKGLLRIRKDKLDARIKFLELTPAGRKVARFVFAKSNAVALSCFRHLKSKERDEIVEAFLKTANAVDPQDAFLPIRR